MIFRPRGRAAFILLIVVLIAALVGGGLMLRNQSAARRAVMAPEAAAKLPVVPGWAIGPVKLGMTQDHVATLLGRPNFIVGPTWSYKDPDMAVMFAKDSPTVIAIFGGGFGAQRTNLPFRSVEGIGLGSTPDEVEAAWGKPDKRSETTMIYLSRGIELKFANGKLEWLCVRTYGTTRPATSPSVE